jgi:hypothetical protein
MRRQQLSEAHITALLDPPAGVVPVFVEICSAGIAG